MVAVVLAEEPCRLRGIPEISDVQVVSGLLELHGVRIDSTDRDGELLLDPTRVEQAHGRHRHPRGLLAGAGAALRTAAAPPGRGVHPRPRGLPHRRAPDQLPPRRAATVRCRDREAAGRPAADGPARAARGRHPPALPERRRHRAGAAHRGPRARPDDAAQRRHRARDHRPHRDPAEDGRPHLGADRPGHHRGGRGPAGRVRPPAIPDRIEAGSWACAALATGGDVYVRGRSSCR